MKILKIFQADMLNNNILEMLKSPFSKTTQNKVRKSSFLKNLHDFSSNLFSPFMSLKFYLMLEGELLMEKVKWDRK